MTDERAILNRIVVAHNRLCRSETTAQEFDQYALGLLAELRTATPSEPPSIVTGSDDRARLLMLTGEIMQRHPKLSHGEARDIADLALVKLGLTVRGSMNADPTLAVTALAASRPTEVGAGEISATLLGEVMQDAWGEICDDADAHPSDMKHGEGTVLFYSPGHWTDLIALRLNERLATPKPPVDELREAKPEAWGDRECSGCTLPRRDCECN